jgi:hypothetical protein
MGLCH